MHRQCAPARSRVSLRAELLPFLRNTRRPKLAYSTWVGWYEDGGLNETSLFEQVGAMAETLRCAKHAARWLRGVNHTREDMRRD